MSMEDKNKRHRVEEVSLDVLLGVKPMFRPKKKIGRLPQLNKRAKRLRAFHFTDVS